MSALRPVIAALRPEWDVRVVNAFARQSRLNRIPLLGDLIAAVLLGMRTARFDVVVVNGAEYAWPRMFGRRSRARTIVVWHGTRAAEVPALRERQTLAVRVYRRLEIWLQQAAFAFRRHVVVSPSVAGELRVTYGRDADAAVIPNGAPRVATLERRPQRGRVLWIGTSPFKKGLDVAVEACRAARVQRPELTLRVVGLGDAAMQTQDRWIDVAGRLPHDRMAEEYRDAEVLLATTRYEGCSMAILEALAHGIPIVGSPTLRWMIAESAPCVDRLDAGEFARAVTALLSDSAARERCSLAERARAADFDWREAGRAYVGHIEACLALA